MLKITELLLSIRSSPEEDQIRDLSYLASLVYEEIGISPIAKHFSKLEIAPYCIPILEKILTDSIEIPEIRGAFLLISEYMEQNNKVCEDFIMHLTSLSCKRSEQDQWILSYILNRMPQLRDKVFHTLQRYGKLDDRIKYDYSFPDELNTILHFLNVLIQGQEPLSISMFDYIFPLKIENKFNYQLLLQTNNLLNESTIVNPANFKLWLKDGLLNTTSKLSFKTYLTQITLISKVKSLFTEEELSSIYLKSSLITPKPLGKFMYSLSKTNRLQPQDVILNKFSLTLAARSSKSGAFDSNSLNYQIQNIILEYFNTIAVSLSKFLKYTDSESLEFIANELLNHIQMKKVDLPNNPFLICEALEIPVIHLELPPSIEGLTVKSKVADRGFIVLNQLNKDTPRENYTLAHEIGHFILHEFPEDDLILSEENSFNKGSISNREHSRYKNTSYSTIWEQEANYFAQLLLIPLGSNVEASLSEIKPRFIDKLETLSKKWNVSQSALLSRYISITRYQAILILANNGDITFSMTSPYWEGEDIKLWGQSIPSSVITYDLISTNHYKYDYSKNVEIQNWVPEYSYNLSLVEESFSTGYGTTCTILYLP